MDSLLFQGDSYTEENSACRNDNRINEFVMEQIWGKGLDDRTRKAYQIDLEHLYQWLESHGRLLSEKKAIKEYLEYLVKERRLKNSTVIGEKLYPVYYPSNRSLKALCINTHRAIKILRKEHPDVIITSGAAPAIPFFWIGKLMGAKTVYIEVLDRINKSTVSGKLCYPVTDKFIVEWQEMKQVYKKAINLGSIF